MQLLGSVQAEPSGLGVCSFILTVRNGEMLHTGQAGETGLGPGNGDMGSSGQGPRLFSWCFLQFGI